MVTIEMHFSLLGFQTFFFSSSLSYPPRRPCPPHPGPPGTLWVYRYIPTAAPEPPDPAPQAGTEARPKPGPEPGPKLGPKPRASPRALHATRLVHCALSRAAFCREDL